MMIEKYTIVEDWIWEDKSLNTKDKLMLMMIMSHYDRKRGFSKVSYEELAKNNGVSRNTAIKTIKRLNEKGYIEINKEDTVNAYKILKGIYSDKRLYNIVKKVNDNRGL